MNRIFRRVLAFILILSLTSFSPVLSVKAGGKKFANEYGVFLSVNAGRSAVQRFRDYQIIVLDTQNGFSRNDIKKLKKQGHKVYSYINVGAIENYRDYYRTYESLALGVYENWPDERWVDVSSEKWQKFIINKLSVRIAKTCIDGFFVDNIDVYYHYHSKKMYSGLVTILKGLKKKGEVIINGGDTFVKEYYRKEGTLNDILDAVNQESVFSCIIDYDKDRFGKNTAADRKYYQEYLTAVASDQKKCYLLEYTKSKKLGKQIKAYCRKKGYKYYISGKLDLS